MRRFQVRVAWAGEGAGAPPSQLRGPANQAVAARPSRPARRASVAPSEKNLLPENHLAGSARPARSPAHRRAPPSDLGAGCAAMIKAPAAPRRGIGRGPLRLFETSELRDAVGEEVEGDRAFVAEALAGDVDHRAVVRVDDPAPAGAHARVAA